MLQFKETEMWWRKQPKNSNIQGLYNSNGAYVECKIKSDTSNNRGNHLNIFEFHERVWKIFNTYAIN